MVTGEIRQTQATRAFLVMLIALAFVMNTIGRGVTESFAVFLLPVQKGLGVTRPEMTATYSIYMLAYGFSAPFAGQLIDRLGARVTYGAGLLILGTGYLMAGWVDAIWQYYICVGLLGGLGSAALGMVAASSLLSRWFTQRIGSIMSLPYAAVGAGMLFFPPTTQLLISHFDWRTAHQVIGLGVLALLPLIMLLPLERISRGSDTWRSLRSVAETTVHSNPWPLSAAIRTSAFWGLFFAYFWTSLAAYSILPQSVAYLVECGFEPLFAASAFGMAGALSTIGIVAIGWISDRMGRLYTVTLSYILTIIGVVSMIFVAVYPSLILVYGFVIFFGLMQGVRGPIIVALVSTLFRGGAVGSIFGSLSMALGLGAGTGSILSGYLHEATGTYHASFALGVIGSLLGIATFWLVPSLRDERLPGTGLAKTPADQSQSPLVEAIKPPASGPAR
jgi:MFS family permease